MKDEIEVISREYIKPSSPTPHHLQNYHFSFLDQLAPPVYMPFIFFFETNPKIATLSNAEKTHQLKTSLSDTLTWFYPLAGRIVDNFTSVNCNDEGVIFVEAAHVKSRLSEAAENPNLGDHNKFLPLAPLGQHHGGIVLAIQVTYFKCGGLAIGVCTSHRIGDALSIFTFITSWAAATLRGHSDEKIIIHPSFDSATLFPPRAISRNWEIKEENIVSKRFVFDNSTVESIRAKYCKSNFRASRIEALSCFIWSRYADVTKPKSQNQVHLVLHAVNLRNKVDPPLPNCSLGNLFRMVVTLPDMNSEAVSHDLAKRMRASTEKLDGVYVKKLREGGADGNLILMAKTAERVTNKGQTMISFHFTSWCGIPLYETDFGWGKPVRVGSAKLALKNLVGFADTRNGDGIEAFISLEKQDMARLEADNEFLSHVETITPLISPLHVYSRL